MSRRYHWISITVFLAAVFSFCIWRDIRIEKQYTTDIRNRIVAARLQKDGRPPYFYKWRPVDGLRYYDPIQTDTTIANAATASPFFHHLLFPIADLPQRQISRIWLVWEYLTFLSIVLFAVAFTKSANQQWAVAMTAVLFLFMNAWLVHVSAGQFYIIVPLLAFAFLFCFIRNNQLFFLFMSGLAASVLILIRPTCILFFIPFVFLFKTFKAKEVILFFLPAVVLFGYSILNTKERSYWLEYRHAIAAHIKIHQRNDLDAKSMAYKSFMYNNWEGWDANSISKAKTAFPFVWHSESSSIGVFSKDALQTIIPAWVIHIISLVSIGFLLFFWIRQNNHWCRSIYAAASIDDPAARQIIRTCTAAGEEARLLPSVPMKMKLADSTTAMLPLTPNGTAGALIIRAPVIITALREYFELLWDRATPLGPTQQVPPGDRLPPAQQKVLELMAAGFNDGNIARKLALSTTTVRRHITAIMHRLGVSSRFAAGAAAQRKGWIG